MVVLLSLYILFFLMFAVSRHMKTPVRRCFSTSCGHNVKGQCDLKQIDIYDNKGVIGLCLWHTVSMDYRLLGPYIQGKKVGQIDGKIAMIDEIQKKLLDSKDTEAIKSPEEFVKWMKRHIKDG